MAFGLASGNLWDSSGALTAQDVGGAGATMGGGAGGAAGGMGGMSGASMGSAVAGILTNFGNQVAKDEAPVTVSPQLWGGPLPSPVQFIPPTLARNTGGVAPWV